MRSLCYVVAGCLITVTSVNAVAQEIRHEGPRSERVALLLGASTVAVSGVWSLVSGNGAIIAGVIVGPALGHAYANNYSRALGGTLGRSALSVVGLLAGYAVCDAKNLLDNCHNEGAVNTVVGLAAAGVLVWSAIDLVKAPESARRYNERHTSQRVVGLPLPRRGRLLDAGPTPSCVTICRAQD
ncbi:MAG: hypothetical protein U0132_17270 [Gemmatimonadaceae bacterium]